MTDLELLEIAGKVAYDKLEERALIQVNNVWYEVKDVSYKGYSSGMQAATL